MHGIRRLIALSAITLATNALAQTQYELEIIPSDEPGECYAFDINEQGQIVGSMWTQVGSSIVERAYFWSPDSGVDLDTAYPRYTRINELGDRLAKSQFRQSDGTVVTIDPAPGFETVTNGDINDSRTVVGATGIVVAGTTTQRAMYWKPGVGSVEIPIIGARVAGTVNNHNQTVGLVIPAASSFQAFYYDIDTGEHIDLHELLTSGGPGTTEPYDINDAGQVAGKGWNGSAYRAWRWHKDDGFTFLPGLNGGDADRVNPWGINNNGVIVGSAPLPGFIWHAFLWSPDDGMVDLNDLVDTDFNLIRAQAINDKGEITGIGWFGDPSFGRVTGFILRPVDAICRADLDGDGQLTLFDFLAFQNLFDAGDPTADFDGDGQLTLFDFLSFQNAFDLGCD